MSEIITKYHNILMQVIIFQQWWVKIKLLKLVILWLKIF